MITLTNFQVYSAQIRFLIMAVWLCDNCKCLEIDDQSLGGFERDGYLVLNDKDQSTWLKTNYFFEDDFPLLPRLTESFHAGCDFCGWLRKTILQPELMSKPPNTPIRLHISYLFGPDRNASIPPLADYGLRAFVLFVDFPLTSDRYITISCNVDSAVGM